MRILQILHNYKLGGAEQHLVQLCVGLRNSGLEIETAVPKGSWIWQRLTENGFTVHPLDFRGHYDIRSLLKLTMLLRQQGYDLVHTHLVRAAWYGRLATKLTNTPMVCSVHDMTTWKHYPRDRQLIAVSAAVKQHLGTHGFDPENIQVVFPGARDCSLGTEQASTRSTIRSELGLQPDDMAIFMIGRIAEVKGHDIALEAISRLHEQGLHHLKLVFAGQETEWGRALHMSRPARYAKWLGRREDVPELLAAADICIQPSRSEGLPLALMEGSSAGKAIIATRVGGIPEVIADHVNGLLIPANDAEALARAIQDLAGNPALALRLGSAARRRFETEFSIATMIEKTLGVYQACLQRA